MAQTSKGSSNEKPAFEITHSSGPEGVTKIDIVPAENEEALRETVESQGGVVESVEKSKTWTEIWSDE